MDDELSEEDASINNPQIEKKDKISCEKIINKDIDHNNSKENAIDLNFRY